MQIWRRRPMQFQAKFKHHRCPFRLELVFKPGTKSRKNHGLPWSSYVKFLIRPLFFWLMPVGLMVIPCRGNRHGRYKKESLLVESSG